MRSRVRRPKHKHFARYGGRGIAICPEWETYVGFRDWALRAGYDPSLTLDRIDNDGDYSPSNCRWTDNKTQQRNRSNSIQLTYRGKTASLAEHVEGTGLKYPTVLRRVRLLGWPIDKALETPLYSRKP
jgi:hypothetical protein